MDITMIFPAIILHLVSQWLKSGTAEIKARPSAKAGELAIKSTVQCFVNSRSIEHSHYIHYLLILELYEALKFDQEIINNAYQSQMQEIEYRDGSVKLDDEVMDMKAANLYLLDRYHYCSCLN